MSLPGLNEIQTVESKTVKLEIPAQSEWRFEVHFNTKVTVRLLSGRAEVFGTELARGHEYTFSGQRLAIFTWDGATVEYNGRLLDLKIAQGQAMLRSANVHFALETQRDAAQGGARPPALLILGDPRAGKSALAKTLVSYATKVGRQPLLVNLDPAASVFLPPGVVSAAAISDILDIEQGWGQPPLSGPTIIQPKQPLAHYFGLDSLSAQPHYYSVTVDSLAAAVHARLEHDNVVRTSGTILDASAELHLDLDMLQFVVEQYSVTAVAFVGESDELKAAQAHLGGRALQLVNLPALKVHLMDEEFYSSDQGAYDRQVVHRAISRYFYGTERQVLSPFTVTVNFEDLVVYKVPGLAAGTSVVDTGEVDEVEVPLQKLNPGGSLQNCVLAVLDAAMGDPPSVLLEAPILGFVQVPHVDESKQFLRLLLPIPGKAPTHPLLLGDYQYHE